MAKQVEVGARGESQERVQYEQTLTAHHHSLPPVYSTPDMIRLMESAGLNALQKYCEPGEISVGTAINIEHKAPVGINAVVKAVAIVERVEGRFYVLKVQVSDGEREIGSGTITRTFVNTDQFLKKYGIPKP